MEKPKRYKLEIKKDIFDSVGKAIVLINEVYKENKKLVGIIECPECGNELHYSIAKSNGHIWGRCKTENCLMWMM